MTAKGLESTAGSLLLRRVSGRRSCIVFNQPVSRLRAQ